MTIEEEANKQIQKALKNKDKTWLVPLEIAKALHAEIFELVDNLRWLPVLNPEHIKLQKASYEKIIELIDMIALRAVSLKLILE